MPVETKPNDKKAEDKAGPHLNPPQMKETTPPYFQPQADVDPIHVAVTNCPDFRESVILLLEGVSADITANADDPNAVRKVAARLKERGGTWADGAIANTNYAPVTGVETEKGRKEREDKEAKEAKK